MKKLTILGIFFCCFQVMAQKKESCCGDGGAMVCKLTSVELRERKAEVTTKLKKEIIETVELKNGMKYAFKDSDETIVMLADFIKTERQCCDFFNFELTVSADRNYIYLVLTGPKGVKDFIKTELEL